jgi:hypothetical protein
MDIAIMSAEKAEDALERANKAGELDPRTPEVQCSFFLLDIFKTSEIVCRKTEVAADQAREAAEVAEEASMRIVEIGQEVCKQLKTCTSTDFVEFEFLCLNFDFPVIY